MTQHTDLIERLRCFDRVTCNEAADALESQSREIAALKEQVEGLRKDAELWRWAITTGRDHRHNIFKAYDNWDGQDSFEDAAIAAKGGSDGVA